MTWAELYKFLYSHYDSDWFNDTVTVYCQETGEYYPCDVIEFQEGDDVLDDGCMFLVIDA